MNGYHGYVFISRGKEFGHDVDFIVTALELGKEESLLLDIIERLKHHVSMWPLSFYALTQCKAPVSPQVSAVRTQGQFLSSPFKRRCCILANLSILAALPVITGQRTEVKMLRGIIGESSSEFYL